MTFVAKEHGKLGKLPARVDVKDINFSLLRERSPLPAKIPARFGHGTIFKDWGMLGNGPDDTVYPGFKGAGCCVESMMGHVIMQAAKTFRRAVPKVTGREVIDAYSAITGYRMGDDSTDLGTDMRQAMSWWQKTGFKDGQGGVHKIGAYVAIDPKSWSDLIEATWVFSAVAIGFDFPSTAWEQFDEGGPWDVVPGAASEGGHCVPTFGRSSLNIAGDVSWAKRIGMTRNFYESTNEETWAFVFPEELKNGKTERGWDLGALTTELKNLGIEAPS